MRNVLRRHFELLSTQRSRFSLRDYARMLGVSHSSLSLILAGKRSGSKALFLKMEKVLALDEADYAELTRFREDPPPVPQPVTLRSEQAQIIPTWVHYAVLNILKLKRGPKKAEGIAQNLGLSSSLVRAVLSELETGGFVAPNGDGDYSRRVASFTVSNANANDLAKRFNRDLLQRAAQSMDDCEFHQRDISSITFPVDSSLVPELKKRLMQVRRKMSALAETKENFDAVYTLAIQLFPLTTKER